MLQRLSMSVEDVVRIAALAPTVTLVDRLRRIDACNPGFHGQIALHHRRRRPALP